MKTEEEKQARKKRIAELKYLKRTGGTIGLNSKKKYKRPGCSILIETFDKWYTKVFTLTIKLHINHIGGNAKMVNTVDDVCKDLKTLCGKWVKEQVEYCDEHICIVETGNSLSSYTGKTKTFSIELTVKRKETTPFKEALKVFEPKIDGIYSSLTSLLVQSGFTLKEFRGYLSDEY